MTIKNGRCRRWTNPVVMTASSWLRKLGSWITIKYQCIASKYESKRTCTTLRGGRSMPMSSRTDSRSSTSCAEAAAADGLASGIASTARLLVDRLKRYFLNICTTRKHFAKHKNLDSMK